MDGDTPQRFGLNAQKYAASLLRVRGMPVKMMPYNYPFDLLLANGTRIEVKAARMHPKCLAWKVNIHRHGKTGEGGVDAYMFLLDMSRLGKLKPLVLIRPAPIERPTLSYSFESLLTIHNWQVENWQAVGADDKALLRKKPPATANPDEPVKKYISR